MKAKQGDIIFEWDENKEIINKRKHKISFSVAMRVFDDENRIERYDSEHSADEDRYITIGMVGDVAVILQVVYTERGEVIRLISARKATAEERRRYYGD